MALSRRVPPVLQEGAADCGIACLAAVLAFHSRNADAYEIKRSLPQSDRGATLATLADLARGRGMAARGLRCTLPGLAHVRMPVIAHWRNDHFVVIESVKGGRVSYMDPAVGRRTVRSSEFDESFSGVLLELAPAATFKPIERERRSSVLTVLRGLPSARSALFQIFLIGLFVEAATVVYPILLQVSLDQVIPSGDLGMLIVLGAAFLVIAILQVVFSYSKTMLTAKFATSTSSDLGGACFWALMQSPPTYFTSRSTGQLLAKFSSLDAIRSVIAFTSVAFALDAIFLVLAFSVLLMYSWQIASVAAVTSAIFLAGRLLVQRLVNSEAHQAISATARQHSFLLESVQAITTIRLFGMESSRQSGYQNRIDRVLEHELEIGRLQALSGSGQMFLFAVENIVFLGIVAALLIGEEITLGIVLAAFAFKSMVSARVIGAVDKLMQFAGLSVHLLQLSDIPEPKRSALTPVLEQSRVNEDGVGLRFEKVSFRYSEELPTIIDGLSFIVEPGEHVCLVAPSGVGKSTLLKLLCGLLEPTEGRILADGSAIHGGRMDRYWKSIAVVRQDDTLFDGTILDNVTAFADSPDVRAVESALSAAALLDEVLELPMGLYTRVGQFGDGLSGGQKQRLMLARALYRRPRLLVLDEATSHLDAENEARVVASIRGMGATVVMAAHRRETIRGADRVLRLGAAHPEVDSRRRSESPTSALLDGATVG